MPRALIHGAEAPGGGNTDSRVIFPQSLRLILVAVGSTFVVFADWIDNFRRFGEGGAEPAPSNTVANQSDTIEWTRRERRELTERPWQSGEQDLMTSPRDYGLIMREDYGDVTGRNEDLTTTFSVPERGVARTVITTAPDLLNSGTAARVVNVLHFVMYRVVYRSEERPLDIEAGFGENRRMVSSRAKNSSSKLPEIILGITGQATISLLGGIALTGSYFSPELKILALLLAIGFHSTLISTLVSGGKLQGILAKLGVVCVSSAVSCSMVMLLHVDTIWKWAIAGVLNLMPAIAVYQSDAFLVCSLASSH